MATLAAFAEDSNAKIRKPLASFDRDGADILVRRVFVDRDADRAGKRFFHILAPLHGADAADDLFDIGWEDYLARGGVCAVEWSENVEEALSGAIRITIHKDPADENVRTITIEGGERFADLGV